MFLNYLEEAFHNGINCTWSKDLGFDSTVNIVAQLLRPKQTEEFNWNSQEIKAAETPFPYRKILIKFSPKHYQIMLCSTGAHSIFSKIFD